MSDDFYLLHRTESEGFFPGWGGESGNMFFRPLTALSYFTDSIVHGRDPAGWHLTNTLWHLVCSLLVFTLARQTMKSLGQAFCAGYLFLLLASHSESVAWVSGRTDLIATAFCLGSIIAFPGKGTLAIPLFAAGLLAKESVLITPLLWIVFHGSSSGWDARSKRLAAAGLAIAGLYITARFLLSEGFLSGAGEMSFATALEGVARYMFRVFIPPLSEGARPFLARYPFSVPLFLAVVLVAAAFITIRRAAPSRAFAAPALAFFVSLAPVIFMKVSLVDTRSERFLYLPGAFAVLALVSWTFRVSGRRTAMVLLTALAILQGAFLYRSNMNWRRAGEMCAELIREPVSDPPESYRGAYVFLNGYDEALLLFGE